MEEELRLLDWHRGEELYIQRMVDNHLKEQAKMPLGFMISRKTLNKNIEKVKEDAKNRFREMKLLFYESQIEEERKRIDKVVEDINSKFEKYMNKQRNIISKNIKPFKIMCKEYNEFSPLEQLEVVSIHCEPFEISFIQEKIKEIK